MDLEVRKPDGTKDSILKVADSVFGVKPNRKLVHQAVVSELSNRRQGTHAAKTRGLVHGGGRKPWRQKGRGVARAGTIRSPLWVGGATTFGPDPHLHIKKLPRKMKQLARRSVLSAKAANGQVVVVNELKFENPQTRKMANLLSQLDIAEKRVTIFASILADNLILSARNIGNIVDIVKASDASVYDLLNNDIVLFDKAGMALLNEQLTIDE